MWGVGCGVWVLGFGVWGLGFEGWGVGFGVWSFGFGVWGLGTRDYGLGLKVESWESRVQTLSITHCRKIWHGIVKPGSKSGPGSSIFKVRVVELFKVVPFSLGSRLREKSSRFGV